MDKDITVLVKFEAPDDEMLPLMQCVCGKKYEAWEFAISIYRDDPYECRSCGRRLYFRNTVKVYEIVEAKCQENSSR